MKTISKYLFFFMLLAVSCGEPDDIDNPDDSSPGVNEYFRMEIDGQPWEVEDDETIGAVLADYGSGPLYGLTSTNLSDSNHFYGTVPYFYAGDTTFSLSQPVADFVAMTFNTDSIYNSTVSGSLHIVRTVVNGMEVFTGDFMYTGTELLHDSEAGFEGEFVIARIL